MKYSIGDEVTVPFGKTTKRTKILSCQPSRGTYMVSIDVNGVGRLFYVREEDIIVEERK